jgi:hypothetical protein
VLLIVDVRDQTGLTFFCIRVPEAGIVTCYTTIVLDVGQFLRADTLSLDRAINECGWTGLALTLLLTPVVGRVALDTLIQGFRKIRSL